MTRFCVKSGPSRAPKEKMNVRIPTDIFSERPFKTLMTVQRQKKEMAASPKPTRGGTVSSETRRRRR